MKLSELNSPENKAKRQLLKMGGYDFHWMRLYLRDMRSMMQNEGARIKERHLREADKYPEWEQMIDDVYIAQLKNHNTNFVGILNNSALVSAVSIFESCFKAVCEHVAIRKHKPFIEHRNEIVKRCKEFISYECKVDLSEIEEYWPVINNAIVVRHLITHEGAILPENKRHPRYTDVLQHIKGNKHFLVRNAKSKGAKHFLVIDHAYIFEFLTIAHDYLLWIIMQVPHRRPTAIKR